MSSISDADQLADRLDRLLPPHGLGVPEPPEGDPALALALRLARGPHPTLDAEAVARIGARMLAAVDSRPAARRITFSPAMGVLRWAAAACLVLVVAVVSTATASARSLPGDTLYPVKRLVEQGRLALASDGSEVTLRLDLAGRRLDEFETLLKQGEVHPETLDDATAQMNSTLALVEDGAGTPETVANRLIDLSARQVALAEEASVQVNGDPAKVIRLHEALTEANAVQAEARQLITPPAKTEAHTVPDWLNTRSRQQNLGRESMVFIPHDATPAPAATVDAPTAVFVQPEAPQSPVVYKPPTVVPTSTPPAVDPGTPDEPPAVDPGNPPGDRPVVGDPGDELDTPTPDVPPTVEPGTPPGDRPVVDDPDERLVVDDPGDPPGDDLGTPVPDLPPTDDPGATPDVPPVAEAGGSLATPLPDLPLVGGSGTPPAVEPGNPSGNDLALAQFDPPPAAGADSPPADTPPAVEAPMVVPLGDAPQAELAPTADTTQVPPGDPTSDGGDGS